MALIQCPDCKREVSDLAPACPSCGRPIAAAPAPSRPGAPGPATPSTPAGPEKTLWEGRPSPKLAVIGGLLRTGVAILVLPGGICAAWFAAQAAAGSLPELDTALKGAPPALNQANVLLLAMALATVLVAWRLLVLLTQLPGIMGTHYKLTSQRLVHQRGIIARSLDEIDLRIVEDVLLEQSMVERLIGVGQIVVLSTDKTSPKFVLRDIAGAPEVRETIRAQAYAMSQRQLFTRQA